MQEEAEKPTRGQGATWCEAAAAGDEGRAPGARHRLGAKSMEVESNRPWRPGEGAADATLRTPAEQRARKGVPWLLPSFHPQPPASTSHWLKAGTSQPPREPGGSALQSYRGWGHEAGAGEGREKPKQSVQA